MHKMDLCTTIDCLMIRPNKKKLSRQNKDQRVYEYMSIIENLYLPIVFRNTCKCLLKILLPNTRRIELFLFLKSPFKK